MNVEALIEEMQEVKEKYPNLEVSEILRIFSIQATKDLTKEIFKLRIK